MEDDDEFGELYTDVLRPVSSSAPPLPSLPPPSSSASSPPRGRPDPLHAEDADSGGGDEERLLFRVPRTGPSVEPHLNSDQGLAQAAAADNGGGEDDWMLGREAPAVDPPENWDDDEDGAVSSRPAVVSSPHAPGEGEPRVLEDEEEEARISEIPDGGGGIGETKKFGAPEENGYPLFGSREDEDLGNLDEAPLIPGLSAEPASSGPFVSLNNEEGKPSQSEDWDSDSEDDLQIVLNDSNHGPLGANRNDIIGMDDDDDDDGEEDLVIVTDQDKHHNLPAMEEQDWNEEAIQPTGDGERKEIVDVAKVTGTTATAPGARIGYSNHVFHGQHHSMYKYVRPGVAPLIGDPAAGTVGLPGSARPPLGSGHIVGQGRGEWRPVGGRGIPGAPKSYHTGFGFPAWANSSGRAFGGGLDFTLPSHKTVFDVDIESFEEKPWRHPGVDISNFFNFGLDEDKWKDYCKRLDQLRLESTMQSKIRVYESGRSEQDYDPDLPPELAAAQGQDIAAENGHGKTDDREINFTTQGRGPAVMRAPLPTGRAIQVEGGGYGERLPSLDTRPPRIRDSDAIIEIALQDSFDDPKMYNCAPEQMEKDAKRDGGGSFHEVEKDDRNSISEYTNYFPHASSSRNKDMTRRASFAKDKDEVLPYHSGSFSEHHQNSRARSPLSHDEELDIHPVGRLPEGSSRARRNPRVCEQSTDSIPSQSAHSSRLGDQQNENLVDSTEVSQSSQKSPTAADDIAREVSVEKQYDKHEEKFAVADSMGGEDLTPDLHVSSDTGGNGNLDHPITTKQKLCSRVEQPASRGIGYENELRTSNSDNSREKSGSSKDYPRRTGNGEVIQGHLSQTSYLKRPQKEDERGLRRKDEYHLDDRQEREKSQNISRGREDVSNSYQNPPRARSYERRKESESSTSSWQRREDIVHGKRMKDEDMWENNDEMLSRHKSKLRTIDRNQKAEDQSRKNVDSEWRGHNRDEGMRQRERNDLLMGRRENKDDPVLQRKRDDEYLRGKADKVDILHGSRDREDSGRRKRERDDGLHHKRRELDTRMRDKAEEHLSSKHKDDSWRHREREDRQRLKPHEIAVTHREREEGRGTVRSGRVTEDKSLGTNGRNRDEPKAISYDKDYQEKERRRRNEISRRDRAREDNVLQNKGRGDASINEKHSNTNDRSSRHERLNTHSDRHPTADSQHMYKERHRDSTSKIKDVQQNKQGSGKRKHDDYHQTEKVYNKDANKQESTDVSSTTLSKKDAHQIHEPRDGSQQHNSIRKQGEDDPASDDENQGSKRGRSKLERWTSHKERDYDAISNTPTLSASSKDNNVDVGQADDLMTKTELNNIAVELDAKGADGGQIVDKMIDDQDRHLDTVAKLKRRSERFKLPMPKDKDIPLNKKMENEVQASNNEASLDSDIKPERPARKRRWTGS
ncbi:FIP1[V]-like protein [Canna indica]|uniref:FIP1[V]-like protein n=1 Tax=Canna indica TaxID=4628 RepID=A0AAQ3JLR6_9LILI|nr:FIP1[V]-like protein [Canna indica]